jgi:hypothetical protein
MAALERINEDNGAAMGFDVPKDRSQPHLALCLRAPSRRKLGGLTFLRRYVAPVCPAH